MQDNHVNHHAKTEDMRAVDTSWTDERIDGFGLVTVCKYCGNAIEVGHAPNCPMCKRHHH